MLLVVQQFPAPPCAGREPPVMPGAREIGVTWPTSAGPHHTVTHLGQMSVDAFCPIEMPRPWGTLGSWEASPHTHQRVEFCSRVGGQEWHRVKENIKQDDFGAFGQKIANTIRSRRLLGTTVLSRGAFSSVTFDPSIVHAVIA